MEPGPTLNGGNVPIIYVLSLGTPCYPALFLRQKVLHPFSGPFDFIFSSLSMVQHCIEDDFKTFLDTTQITAAPGGGPLRWAHHKYYSPMLPKPTGKRKDAGLIFNHHNALLPKSHLHFRRATARFISVMTSQPQSPPGRTLLLMMSRTPPDLVGLEALFQTLQDKYGRGGFELLAIGLAPAGEANDARSGEGSPDHAPAFTLLLQKTGNAATPGACLRVYLQRCVGSYTGDKFTDPRDAAAFETHYPQNHCSSSSSAGKVVARVFLILRRTRCRRGPRKSRQSQTVGGVG
eukprot:gene20919-31775_t